LVAFFHDTIIAYIPHLHVYQVICISVRKRNIGYPHRNMTPNGFKHRPTLEVKVEFTERQFDLEMIRQVRCRQVIILNNLVDR
jgi:hypothetical protein